MINNWKHSITQQNIDEMRDFIVLVKKSNISIEQCAEGFRFINILKNFGIGESEDNSIYDKEKDNYSKYNEFSTFIPEIYLQCKSLGVASHNIISWIKDLLDIYSNSNSNYDPNKNISNILIENDNNLDKRPSDDLTIRGISKIENESIYKTNFKDNYNSSNNLGPIKETIIPFISQISYYISKEKRK